MENSVKLAKRIIICLVELMLKAKKSYSFFTASTGDKTDWNEQVRYQFNTQDAFTVQNLLNVLQDDNNERGLLQWIEQA